MAATSRRRLSRGLSRRDWLRGSFGLTLGLPLLETFVSGAETPAAPARLAYVYVPNGMNMPEFVPTGAGLEWTPSPTLAALAHRKSNLTVFSGLNNAPGSEDVLAITVHARASSTFLTNRALGQPDGSFRNGLSIDQLAAREIGFQTRFPSLQLCCTGRGVPGQTEAIYSRTLSWTAEGTPLTGENDPRSAFERMFVQTGANSEARRTWLANRRSVLDFVLEDAKALESRVAQADRAKLDEYLTSVRAVERVIQQAGRAVPAPSGARPPQGVPEEPGDYMNVMLDLVVLAFQTDQTRVVTLMLGEEASDEQYKEIQVFDPYHQISHHANQPEQLHKIAEIDRFHVGRFDAFLRRLEGVATPSGTLLDDTAVLYGSGLSNGNSHSFTGLPLVLAGGGAGRLRHAGHLQLPEETPVANLHRTLLEVLDVPTTEFGDSTGTIPQILA
jgi:hypothetical protein